MTGEYTPVDHATVVLDPGHGGPIELGYLANPAEAALFATDDYVSTAAVAIADAVVAHLTTDRAGTGFGNPPRVIGPGAAPGSDSCTDPILG